MTGIHQLNNNKGVTVATATRPEMVEQVNYLIHDIFTGYISHIEMAHCEKNCFKIVAVSIF